MKKKIPLILTGILMMGATPTLAAETVSAKPAASKVLVNGKSKSFEAYNINGNNYFKLRDIAYVLKDTEAAFSVGWNQGANAISLDTSAAYAPTGREMKGTGNTADKKAVASNSAILIDGQKAPLKAYNIDGNNYFKLRDLGSALGFQISWDTTSQTISIKTDPSTVVKPSEKTTLTAAEAKKMGFHKEICGIHTSKGFLTECVTFGKNSPFDAVSVNSVTVNGTKCSSDVFTAAYVEGIFGPAKGADFYLQYQMPKNTILLNDDKNSSDYGKKNDVVIAYSLQTSDGKIYTYTDKYNLLCDGDSGVWIQ